MSSANASHLSMRFEGNGENSRLGTGQTVDLLKTVPQVEALHKPHSSAAGQHIATGFPALQAS